MTDPERTLEQLVGDLERLEGVAAGWDDAQRGTLTALRTTIYGLDRALEGVVAPPLIDAVAARVDSEALPPLTESN